MNPSRRAVLAGMAASSLLPASRAWAQAWPQRPIKIIIPFPPGNTLDIMSRLIQPKLAELLGQPVVVENMAGASGQLGLSAVARAAPDGYTIGGGQGGTLTTLPHTTKKLSYDPLKDFAPIALSTTNFCTSTVFSNTCGTSTTCGTGTCTSRSTGTSTTRVTSTGFSATASRRKRKEGRREPRTSDLTAVMM